MSDLHAAIEHFENSPGLRREFAYTLQAMKDARDALEQAQARCDELYQLGCDASGRADNAEQRIEQLEAVFQRIADSGIENNFAWAWIGGIAKQILQTVPDKGKDDG